MLKSKIFTDTIITKLTYISLAILLLFLFIDTPTKTIERASLKDFYSGSAQALFVILAFLGIKQMIKKVALFFISLLLLVNIIVAAFSLIPEPELNNELNTDTNTSIITDTSTDTQVACDTVQMAVEFEQQSSQLLQSEDFENNESNDAKNSDQSGCKSSLNDSVGEGMGDTGPNVFLRNTWFINFLILAVFAYGALIYFRKKSDVIIIEEIEEEIIEAQEIEVEEITLDSYEDGVYSLYRQLCGIAETNYGITRRQSMTSSEYGELLVQRGFAKNDVFEIINAFEALRYGKIQVSAGHVDRLNQALVNINMAIKQTNEGNIA